MTTVRVVLTYEDCAATPNDGKRYEILDGALSVTPAPGRTSPGDDLMDMPPFDGLGLDPAALWVH